MSRARIEELCNAVENGSARLEDVKELVKLARQASIDAFSAASFAMSLFDELAENQELTLGEESDRDEALTIQESYRPA